MGLLLSKQIGFKSGIVKIVWFIVTCHQPPAHMETWGC